MTLQNLPDETLNLWIAEKLGWRFEVSASGSFWHHPLCIQPQGHKECGRSVLNFVNDPAMTLMLLENMPLVQCGRGGDFRTGREPKHLEWTVSCKGNVYVVNKSLGRAVAEAFCLANGWKE